MKVAQGKVADHDVKVGIFGFWFAIYLVFCVVVWFGCPGLS